LVRLASLSERNRKVVFRIPLRARFGEKDRWRFKVGSRRRLTLFPRNSSQAGTGMVLVGKRVGVLVGIGIGR
jgi:hypothetical protein